MTTETTTKTICDACGCVREHDTDDGQIPTDWAWLRYAVRKDDDDRWGEFPEEYDICPACLNAVEGILHAKEAK